MDTSFGTNGKVITTTLHTGPFLLLQNDGKILTFYITSYSELGNIHIARYNVDGSLDANFGDNGNVNTILFVEGATSNLVQLQSDGKILVTGNVHPSGTGYKFGTARYNSIGTLDTSFGDNGYAVTAIGGLDSYGSFSDAIAIQNDGKILIGGSGYSSTPATSSADIAVVRYNSNGIIDTSFATNGKFIYNFGINNSGQQSSDSTHAIKINASGKIIVAGSTNATFPNLLGDNGAIICLNSNGTIDTSFGNNGMKVIDFGLDDGLFNLHITPDNKIIATGRSGVDAINLNKIAMVKLLENGDFDTSFGTNGILVADNHTAGFNDIIFDFNMQDDGKVTCFGATRNADYSIVNPLLIRYNSSGLLDSTFNGTGYFTSIENQAVWYGGTIQNDGKILCGGVSGSPQMGFIERYFLTDLSTNTFDNNIFSVYPNPFTAHISIDIKGMNIENTLLELYDISGRKLMNLDRINTSNFEIPLDKNLSKGNYFLKITNENKTETFKIIKQ